MVGSKLNSPILELRQLQVELHSRYGTINPVDGLDLRLSVGECLALVGESGCGKSITLRAIMGLLPHRGRVTSGSIHFDGREITPENVREIRGHGAAMVFQEPMTALNPVMRVGDYICESVRRHRGLKGDPARRVAMALLDEVGIHDARNRFRAWPHELSGGMRQRVMIAAALAGEPRVLLADEPTTALDVTVQQQILDLLNRLRVERGLAVVFVSHDLAVVRQVAQRIQVMYAGRSVETGTTDEVLEQPIHPYTAGLLRALPSIEGSRRPLVSIPGSPPTPSDYPAGCRFSPRCEHYVRSCDESAFEPIAVEHARTTACSRWQVIFGDRGDARRLRDGRITSTVPQPCPTPSSHSAETATAVSRVSGPNKDPLLEARNLEVTYRMGGRFTGYTVRALRGLSFTVNDGEVFGIVGESGCGKSTFARVAAGLVAPSGGDLCYRGTPMTRDVRSSRAIQMVFQDPGSSLDPRMTVGQTLSELLLYHKVCEKRRVRERCIELLALVRLGSELLDVRPRSLSGGQKQRVGIARALALEPEVIIADEAVAALDVSVQAAVLNVLTDLRDRLGLTIVLIAHDLAVVRNVCDRVAVMYAGRVVETAGVDELYSDPLHPYTKALLEAVPRLHGANCTTTTVDVMPVSERGGLGCAFAPRCPSWHDRCSQAPDLVGDEHLVACHLATGGKD